MSSETRHLDEEEKRLLDQMEESFLDLELFQTRSIDDPNVINDAVDYDSIIDMDEYLPFSSDNSELSLLFPQIEPKATTEPAEILIDSSVALSGNGAPSADGNNVILQKDDAKSGLNGNDLIDEEGVWRARWDRKSVV